MQPRSGGASTVASSTLRGVLVPGCRDDDWRMRAARARLGDCLWGVVRGSLQISSTSLAHSTGAFCAYVACVKMASAGGKKRAATCVPYQSTDAGGDRETGENADLWT